MTRAKSCQTVVLKTKSVKHCLLFLLKTRIVQWHCLQLLALREDILYKWCWHGTPWCITIICHAVITDNDLNTLISSDHSATGHNSQYLDVSLTGPGSRSSSGQFLTFWAGKSPDNCYFDVLPVLTVLICWGVKRAVLVSDVWCLGLWVTPGHVTHWSWQSYQLQLAIIFRKVGTRILLIVRLVHSSGRLDPTDWHN